MKNQITTTKPTNFTILSFADFPNYLDELVDQQWQEWGYDHRQDLVDFFKQEFDNGFPKTWLLVDNDRASPHNLIGAVTLSLNEMGDNQPPSRNPWLGYLYIETNYRGLGFAKILTQYAVEQAQTLGFEKVYLYATDETARYQKWGWQIIQTLSFQGEVVNVMQI